MATEKKIMTRIQLKYDSFENWTKNNPILKAGEMAVTTVAAKPTKEANSVAAPQVLAKFGDGEHNYNDLPWLSGLAADVYEWAKSATPNVSDFGSVITEARKGLISADSVVKTLNGLMGDITINGDNEGYITISKDGQDLAINFNISDGEQEAWASGITAAKVNAYDGYDSRITNAKSQADKGVTDAAEALTKANTVLGTSSDPSTAETVFGARALAKEGKDAAKAAQETADAALSKTEFNNFKTDNTTAINDAKKAGTDAAEALNSYRNDNDIKVNKNTTDIGNLQTAIKSGISFKGKLGGLPANIDSYNNGDLVIVGKKEYILFEDSNGKEWIELGDEGSHLTKATADEYYVAKNTAITGATKAKITYDSKGLVTGGADLTAEDIPDISASKITSGEFSDARIASAATWNGKQNALTEAQLSAVNSGINSTLVEKYNKYETSKQDTLTGSAVDAIQSGITADKVTTYDGYASKIDNLEGQPGLQKVGTVINVSTPAGSGLKITNNTTAPSIEFDESIVFVFDCGSSSTNI